MDAVSARTIQPRKSLDLDDWDVAPPSKRKKVRRGTRSCWECKRRKMKCVFENPNDAVCVGCHRRWTNCVSQEFPEKVSTPLDNRQLRDRLRRVESQLDQFLRVGDDQVTADGPDGPDHSISIPISISKPPNSTAPASHRPITATDGEPIALLSGEPSASGTDALSRALCAFLPSREDTAIIYRASSGQHSIPFHEILTTPYNILDQDGHGLQGDLLEIPGLNAHPVLIARYMLHLASFLQHLHPDLHEELRGLSESTRIIRERLADKAISLVSANDRFVGSIEFLECVMIESLYQANCGYLRRSWRAVRRAMTIAQSMGFHRSGARVQYKVLHPETKAYPHFMWFRIVFYDRQMCLILGMPQGTTDQNIACDAILANDTASGRLERVHCVIAARILERNDSESTIYDYSWTKSLDKELQRAARRLPSRWWLIPNLSGEPKDSKALFWEMRRLSAQLLHYNLFNQIHLPYMIRHSDERKFEYSRHTCVNSSREILSRFIMLRRWNQVAFSCRTIDFTALMAAITLLLAHLDNHRSSQEENLLAPQYLGDRAMIEQAQENMEELNRLNPDTLSSRSAQLLKRLLAIEAMAAEGDLQSAQSVSVQGHEMEEPQSESMASSDKNVYIPYFGVIKGAGEIHACATSSKVQCMPPANTRQTQLPIFEQGEPEAKRSMHSTFVATSVHPESHSSYQHNKNNRNSTAKYIPALLTPLLSGVLLDDPMQQVSTAGMASSLGDDVFQDLDLAFLDNLLGGNNEDEQGSAEWNAT